MKSAYKICDAIHGFIRFDKKERQVIDSAPFQRLRYIRQMGVAYLVYPGATHTRFEHSLGVMELATRIYDTLTSPFNKTSFHPEDSEEIKYWRLILRLAALCHDLGHLPFSHTAEKNVLPNGGHEKMTLAIIQSSPLQEIWQEIGPHAEQDIIKLSMSETEQPLTPWERVLSKILTEDNFGADRIDYLIRDSHHTGVGYGHFDYHQLIDSLCILQVDGELALGITASGIQSVESLWIARYMMYARVYHHPKSHLFTHHMNRFMSYYYKDGLPPLPAYLDETDATLLVALVDHASQGNFDALCLLQRKKGLEQLFPEKTIDPKKLEEEFKDAVFIDYSPQKEVSRAFPVLNEKGEVLSSYLVSPFLKNIPSGEKELQIYVHPDKIEEVKEWTKSRQYSLSTKHFES